MQQLLLMEQVDVRRADDPDDSRVLTINKLGLPKLTRKTAEHTPGGGVGTMNFVLPMLEAFAPTFSTKGIDLAVLRQFGFAAGEFDRWIFAATLRNTRTQKIVAVRATIEGIISEWSPGDHTPGELIDCDHTFNEVSYTDLVIDNTEMYAWGFYARIARSGGRDYFAPYRQALGV